MQIRVTPLQLKNNPINMHFPTTQVLFYLFKPWTVTQVQAMAQLTRIQLKLENSE